jgi:hypothetical protein
MHGTALPHIFALSRISGLPQFPPELIAAS